MAAELIHGGDIYSCKIENGIYPLDHSANTNPFGIPESVKKAIACAAKTADRYPDPLCRELRKAIAAHEGIDVKNIYCSNGAADIIYRLVWAKKPQRALLIAPCFAEYELALKSVGCGITRLFTDVKNNFDVTEVILQKLERDIDIVFLCNPNNPTGRLIDDLLLQKIALRCEENETLLVIDECFLGFCDDYERRSLKYAAESSRNVVVINAFTKLYGMAGVRLGWCVSSDEKLMVAMNSAGQPWTVSSLAQAAGTAALNEKEYVEKTRALILSERRFLTEKLNGLNLKAIESHTNFLLFYSRDIELAAKLAKEHILIRDCSNFCGLGKGWFRIAVRGREENERLTGAIAKALKEEA